MSTLTRRLRTLDGWESGNVEFANLNDALAAPAMQLLRCLFSLSTFALVARAIHESEVGIVDWHTKLVGVPLYTSPLTKPVFHNDTVLTATSNNVLAALNVTDGSIGPAWFCSSCPRP